jgi:YVTN family beta-propeller protein
MALTQDARIGTTLAGYRIERLLGRGGMSVVYLAEDLRLGRRVALKLIAPDLAADERFRERFLRESRIAASLDHSNVIPIYEAGEADGLLYIAMRYVQGTELKSVLAAGRLSTARAVDLISQAASALDLAHARGLVHRDVKPANILLADEDGRGRTMHVYLSDFGLTKQASSESGLTETGQFVGTAEYIAPEQIEHEDVGPRSDVYALTCVLYECLTGEPPFRRDSLMAVLWAHVHDPPPSASGQERALPREIDAVIARGMAKSPLDRYATCGELANAARGALQLGAARPTSRGLREIVLREIVRRPHVALAALAAVAALAALIAAVAIIARDGEAVARPTVELDVDSLQRIDPRTGRLVATVPLGASVGQLAAGEGGVWALDLTGGYWRIDEQRNAVASSGTVSGEPAGIAAGLGYVWIANREGATATSATITQIEPRPGRAIPIPVSQRVPNESTLSAIAVSGRGEGSPALWLASPFELAVHRLRPRLGSVVATVDVGLTAPRALAVGEGAVWVARAYAVTRVDPARNAVAETISLPFSPRDVAAGAGALWVVNGTGDAVWVVDPQTNSIVDRIAVGRDPVAVAVGEGAVWVANRGDGTVTRIDPVRGRVVATIEVGGKPEDVAARGGAVWVAAHRTPSGSDGRFSEEEYLEALRAADVRFGRLWHDAFQPITRAFNSRRVVAILRAHQDAAREVVRLSDTRIVEVQALEPPERFAADHTRFVEGLRRLHQLNVDFAAALARRAGDEVAAAINGIQTEIVAIESSLSDEYERHVRVFPTPLGLR